MTVHGDVVNCIGCAILLFLRIFFFTLENNTIANAAGLMKPWTAVSHLARKAEPLSETNNIGPRVKNGIKERTEEEEEGEEEEQEQQQQHQQQEVINLVFYAQSTITVISGREKKKKGK